ncbi:hypothetical protein [Chengkuizengella axinellae]|uniref:Butirosin biosynthesis protein H N-terminal domain-containing protein n=1 Tax=Chengkuizengella axinellae TaxID=3064388 RepID=A0ABT9IU78_9BACL|nr:hypothetical protein [Chengkuizengella sp. 2205SS18-9]MDP5272862.1 hypothetical protein [Chengkuizengella sp. 2205SS18-9]
MKKAVSNIKLIRESKSFIDCLHAVLLAANLYKEPKYMLSGKSGMAFKFCVHRELLPLSVTSYGQWEAEHHEGMENVGILSNSFAGYTRHPTFPLYQEAAIFKIKQSIDKGIAVIFWEPEFCVIHGYDDEEQIFFYTNGLDEEEKVVLYDNFGLNITPFWYVHIVTGKADVSDREAIQMSLQTAIMEWETSHKTPPDTSIASGRLGIQYWINALECGKFDQRGAAYILSAAIQSKCEITSYMNEVQGMIPQVSSACKIYLKLSSLYEEFRRLKHDDTFELIRGLKEAMNMEEKAIKELKKVTSTFPNSYPWVPRWGTGPTR